MEHMMDYQMNSSSCYFNSEYTTHEWWNSMIRVRNNNNNNEEEEELTNGLRKGPWTEDEDSKLTSAIAIHGGGRWNNLANLAGLKRSGKSCRLRWLNYLRPDLRRGSFTLHEQLLILQLHFHWGNRWSKIAESLPGRTDNEIKNYWRTKVQKLARQFHCQVNSPEFRDALSNIWIPRLIEQIHAGQKPTSTITKTQNEGPTHHIGPGLKGSSSSSSTSSETCMLDTHTSWAQNSLDQHVIGPVDMFSQPNNITDLFVAQISPESSSSAEWGPNWEQMNNYSWDMILNDGDEMLFLQQQLDYLGN